MSVAAFAIGLAVSVVLLLQLYGIAASGLLMARPELEAASGIGLVVVLLATLAAGFTPHAPHIARWLFGAAALLSLAATGSFDDMAFWGLALSVPCLLTFVEAKRAAATQAGNGTGR